jgi:signal peptide peptidase SppA
MTYKSARAAFAPVRHWARIYNTPLLILPAALEAMLPGIEAALRREEPISPEAFVVGAQERAEQSGLRVERGVAVIPVYGPLLHRGRYDAECNYLVGYQQIAQMFAAALDDPQVRAIVPVFDTPGGEVGALFDTAVLIAQAAKRKPVHAAVSESACSAGYALASACDTISVSQTATVGSIGVYCRHVSMEALLKKEGIVITEFFAGKHKTDGTPYKDIPADVAARIQGRIDTLYTMFVDLVAVNRKQEHAAIVATDADCFMGEEAVAAGLADRLDTPDALIERLVSQMNVRVFMPGASTPLLEDNHMSIVSEALGLPADASESQILAKIASVGADSAAAERTRVFAILGSQEAKGREPHAIALAKVPAMTQEAAAEVLAALPATVAASAPSNQFAEMMTKIGNPDIGADSDRGDEDKELATARQGWAIAFAKPSETR